MTQGTIEQSLSARVRALEASKIREVAEAGMKLGGVVPLWFGEGAWPTNPHIVDAAVTALRSGNHMYQPNNGALALREEICRYSNALFGADLRKEQITVTPSGMQGLMLAAQILTSPGDRVVAIDPSWPNIIGAFRAMGAEIAALPLTVEAGKWALDMDALLAMLTPQTRVFVINSPNNPTGWAMGAADQKIVLEHCRKHGIWVVADDVYSRLYRHGKTAPSFLSIATPEDRLISINSFSKCWSMTGWRLGWMVAPAEMEAKLGQLTEFNTSCTAGFVQDAGIVALRDGEDEVVSLTQKIQTGYQIAAERLSSFDRVTFVEPDGAFYLFFKVAGMYDSLQAAHDIMQKTKVGLAPGVAFGPQGEGYLRLCYAQPEDVLTEAFYRLAPALSG
ncbi:pyridoxal phosphate-dependent aminotransferase [Shimia sp. MMG029]|uniref:pyridoxal phosphate-dependent aminotransferase n=1 Tax=Shimia sp. MMG029 TaxID=3021978 RepID=UPI0022FEB9D8|nr:pyridoxal phosphate-dependent aminotransferase [Shimia sp. MMG029]MDA5558528.1 pyridoxal phosphate-dependent aminotransferase [Shimia sp. MMG029]